MMDTVKKQQNKKKDKQALTLIAQNTNNGCTGFSGVPREMRLSKDSKKGIITPVFKKELRYLLKLYNFYGKC